MRAIVCADGARYAVIAVRDAQLLVQDDGMFKRLRPTAAREIEPVVPAATRDAPASSDLDFTALVDAARTGPVEEVDRVGALLVDRALLSAGDALALLRLIAAEPAVLVRLDGIARYHGEYYGPVGQRPWVDQACGRLGAGTAGPVEIAVASLAADGRVRERAVAAMGGDPSGELLPFLVLRTADWVAPVRERACAALALALYKNPVGVLVAGPIAARLTGWARADFALVQVRAALPRVPDEAFTRLLTGPHPRLRRLAAEHADRLTLPALVKFALAEADPAVRDRLAEAAVRGALWSGRHEFLRALAVARSPDVRAIALAGLLRAGLAEETVGFLADPSPLVRATARFAARKSGVDVLERYRALAAAQPVEPAALLGLAEATANTNAATAEARELIEPQLGSDAPRVRAAVVAALRLLDVTDHGLLVPLLADPAPPVVRAVAGALEADATRVDPALLLGLLADPTRPLGARRALYRLCRRHHASVQVAAALASIAVDDPKLAAWAGRDLRQMALAGGWPLRPTTLRLDLAGQRSVPDLRERLDTARPYLEVEIFDALTDVVA